MEGHVIAEYDAVPQRLRKEYVWLNDTPLALIDHSTGTPALCYVHTDHLNRHIAMSGGTKTLVAQWTWLPFGGVYQLSGTTDLDLRFLDPTIGRNTQPDPLGLADALNLSEFMPLRR